MGFEVCKCAGLWVSCGNGIIIWWLWWLSVLLVWPWFLLVAVVVVVVAMPSLLRGVNILF